MLLMHRLYGRRRRLVGIAAISALVACTGERSASDQRERVPPDTNAGPTPSVGPPRPPARAGYVGLQYDSLPGDFTFEGGAVIPPAAAPGGAEYDFSYVRTPRGDMIWLDTLSVPAGHGLRARIVRGTLVIPPLGPDERLVMASCDVRGRFDPRVVAIVVNESGASRFTRIRQAWRVDFPSGRFDIIPVTGVVCEEPGGG